VSTTAVVIYRQQFCLGHTSIYNEIV
jgi:hypothetical protein